ncbi:glycosyltransferase, partial [Streptomyces celluloflavus]|uniref:glycosyltransferase n=1 Tax=Streptomyces celluloflavus TaxID=58344 RepID=UPI003698E36F
MSRQIRGLVGTCSCGSPATAPDRCEDGWGDLPGREDRCPHRGRARPHIRAPHGLARPQGRRHRVRPWARSTSRTRAWRPGRTAVIRGAARLVPCQGPDTPIRAGPRMRRGVPDAVLRLVGGGPYERRQRQLASAEGSGSEVVFAGAQAQGRLPSIHPAANTFAMPCRTWRRGLVIDGLGIVFREAEAEAAGSPVLVGDSGGAPFVVRNGKTGRQVDGHSPRPHAG